MSDDNNKPGSTLGDLISSLFGGNKTGSDVAKGFASRHKLLSGALLAAGVFYLYKRVKNKETAF